MGEPAQAVAGRPGVVWRPQPGPQTALLSCPCFEVLYGGARGGGKTDGMLGDFAAHAGRYGKDASGVFFRRRAKNLEDVIRRSLAIYSPLGASFVGGNTDTWTFPNGATLKFRHLWDEKAAEDYQGHAYTRVYFEELSQWPDSRAIDRLRATLRSAAGVPTGFRATTNPGGPGHNWVKARYVAPAPGGYVPILDPETGKDRVFIPARLEDNRILTDADPEYERVIMGAGSAALVKAWRWGDWDIVAGGFFDAVWRGDRHVLPSLDPPAGRGSFRRSFDWGSASPASLGLWWESDGNPLDSLGGRIFPRGSLIRFAEWYTVAKDRGGLVRPNEGLRINNQDLGAGIAKRSQGRRWRNCVADPSIFAEQGGPSIYDQMREGAKALGGIAFDRADNSRVAGWQRVLDMLGEAAKDVPERPGLWVTEDCVDFIRTVPVLQADQRNPDDLDTDAEDHAADDTRYAVMAARRGMQTAGVVGLY